MPALSKKCATKGQARAQARQSCPAQSTSTSRAAWLADSGSVPGSAPRVSKGTLCSRTQPAGRWCFPARLTDSGHGEAPSAVNKGTQSKRRGRATDRWFVALSFPIGFGRSQTDTREQPEHPRGNRCLNPASSGLKIGGHRTQPIRCWAATRRPVHNQTVQRTGASRFALRQIERHRRLAPVADLCVRSLHAI